MPCCAAVLGPRPAAWVGVQGVPSGHVGLPRSVSARHITLLNPLPLLLLNTQVVGYPTSVAALAFNASATLLAVAASYTFEQARCGSAAWD